MATLLKGTPSVRTDKPGTRLKGVPVELLERLIDHLDHAADEGAFKGWEKIEQVAFDRQLLIEIIERLRPRTT